jgi:predicted transcriptional regulator
MNYEEIVLFMSQLGFSENETKLYLKLLELGPSSIAEINKITRIPRTTITENLAKLSIKGLVETSFKGSFKKYIAKNPTYLEKLIREKEIQLKSEQKKLDKSKQKLPNLVQDILNLIPEASREYELGVKYYEGREAVRRVYLEEIFEVKELHGYSNAHWVTKELPDVTQKLSQLLKDNKITCTNLLVESYPPEFKTLMDICGESENYKYKILPYDENLFGVDYTLFAGKIAMIYKAQLPIAIIINSEILFKQALATYKIMWNLLP